MDWPGWLSLLAAAASAFIGWRQYRSEERHRESEKRLQELDERIKKYELAEYQRAEEERRRADIKVSLMWYASNDQKLIIENRGGADATEVNVEFSDQHQVLPRSEDEKLPIPKLPAGDEITFIASTDRDTKGPFPIVVSWRDPRGPQREKRILYLSK